jgi:release factor glutamine methyltransferase
VELRLRFTSKPLKNAAGDEGRALPTINDAITEGTALLESSAIDQPYRAAGVILQQVLGVDRTYLITRPEEEVPPEKREAYLRLVERRAAGEPIQYLTGRQEFYGLDFIVNHDVLIPRPETEHLVEQVIKLSRARGRLQHSDRELIVDVGTGSGCIAVSIAVNLPHAELIAIDVSGPALAVARANAERHGVAARIQFIEGDLLVPLEDRSLEGSIDFIASNPPYVPDSQFQQLQREIRHHEPQVALLGGPDGLEFYRRLLDQSSSLLAPDGCLIFEIGFSQLDSIRELINSSDLHLEEVSTDLQGIPRTLTLTA